MQMKRLLDLLKQNKIWSACLVVSFVLCLAATWPNGTSERSTVYGETHTVNTTSASQAWDIDSLREAHSKPMSADQEIYNNVLYLYLSVQGNYSKYNDTKKAVYDFDHTKLTPDMKDFVSRFVTFLDKIGAIERRIANCQNDREEERNDSSFSSGLAGGFKSAATLSQFDDGDIGPGAYLLAGLIGGAIEASENDARIKKKYERAVSEYRNHEDGLYIGFKQDINKMRNSETFKTFDKDRLLTEDVVSATKEDSTKVLQLIQCSVPELSFRVLLSNSDSFEKQPEVAKKYIIANIANYPRSLNTTRRTELSASYLILSSVVLAENVLKKSPREDTDIGKALDAMSPAEVAVVVADPIAILDEGIKHDSGNDSAFYFRAALRWKSGDCRRALADINNAISISPEKSYFYDKACILAKEFKDAQGAKAAIHEAFKKGFCDIKKLKADKDLAILQSDAEFLEMTKVKFSWWYKKGIMYSEIFVKNESCFRLTNVQLVSASSNWRWSLPESGTITLEPGESFSKDWYDNPPSYAQTSAEISCDQNAEQ